MHFKIRRWIQFSVNIIQMYPDIRWMYESQENILDCQETFRNYWPTESNCRHMKE